MNCRFNLLNTVLLLSISLITSCCQIPKPTELTAKKVAQDLMKGKYGYNLVNADQEIISRRLPKEAYLSIKRYIQSEFGWRNPHLLFHGYPVVSVALSPDGQFIVTASNDYTAKIWNINNGQLIHTLGGANGHTGTVDSIAISSDNQFIVTGSADTSAKVWNAYTGQLICTLGGDYDDMPWIDSVAISSDNQFIVTGSWYREILKIWKRCSYEEILQQQTHILTNSDNQKCS